MCCPASTVIFTVAPFRDDHDKGAIGVWLAQLTVDPPVQIIAVVVHVSFLLTTAQLTLFSGRSTDQGRISGQTYR